MPYWDTGGHKRHMCVWMRECMSHHFLDLAMGDEGGNGGEGEGES